MKRILFAAAVFLCGTFCFAQKITFMPQWTAQTQFAGYYVAQEKGFYAQEGLEVDIRHIQASETASPLDHLVKADVDIAGAQLINAIKGRAGGMKILNVMQLVQESALCCVATYPIKEFEDLQGKRIGTWLNGYGEIGETLRVFKGLEANWVKAYSPVNLFLYNAVDVTLCASYNELITIMLTKGDIPKENVMRFSELGLNCPEDGLYVTEKYYKKNKDAVDRFVRASKKGWDYAREHQDEALQITKKYVEQTHVVTNDMKQRLTLEEILRLSVNYVSGNMDYEPVRREIFEAICKGFQMMGALSRVVEYDEMIVH